MSGWHRGSRLWATCSSLWLGVVGGGRWVVVLFVGGGRRLWVLSVVRGGWVVARGGWAVVLGAGLSTVGAGAHLRKCVVRGCWPVVSGRSGDVSCAVVTVSVIG